MKLCCGNVDDAESLLDSLLDKIAISIKLLSIFKVFMSHEQPLELHADARSASQKVRS